MRWITMLVFSVVACYSQSAQVRGEIRDSSKAVIHGASIVASNTETGLKRSTHSDGHGYYTVLLLPPGVYLITVRASGFQTAARDNVTLLVEEHARIDFSLEHVKARHNPRKPQTSGAESAPAARFDSVPMRKWHPGEGDVSNQPDHARTMSIHQRQPAGKVNSANTLYLVIESVKLDAKHRWSSNAPAPADGARE